MVNDQVLKIKSLLLPAARGARPGEAKATWWGGPHLTLRLAPGWEHSPTTWPLAGRSPASTGPLSRMTVTEDRLMPSLKLL